MPLRLLVTVGPEMGAVFELASGKACVLGRGDDCDVQLSDARISRHHCRVIVEGGRAMLEDLGSSWGTLVNGEKIETLALQPGDVISLCETQLRFEVASDAAAMTWGPGTAAPDRDSTPVPAIPAAKKIAPSDPASLKPRSLEDLVGQTVYRFEVLEILARAKTGMVFRAWDSKGQRPVALKVLWPEFSRNEEDMQRFVRAITAMAGIRHPNLVHIYGAGKTGPYCWTAAELLDADSLARRMEQAGEPHRLPWKQVLQIAADIARALAAAAEHKVVHRNITPANILIDRKTGRAKLGDLMLAKALEGGEAQKITRPGEAVGELPYLAPEQFQARGAIDTRADIYSLGATIYEGLTGQPPITGRSLSETIRNIETADPVPPARFNPQIPAEFEKIVLRMLAKNPADRFPSAGELLVELEALARIHGLAESAPAKSAVPIALPVAPVAKPIAKPAQPAAGVPLIAVEEQSVTARLKNRKPARKGRGKKTPLLLAGGIGGALVLTLGILAATGFFAGDSKPPATAGASDKSKDKESEDSGSVQATAFSPDNPLGGSTDSPFGEPDPQPVTEPMELPELIKRIEPSIARIDVETFEGAGSGSGFIVDREGTLVTNFHVIAGADKATAVFNDGRQVRVEGVWHTDPERDIAILKLNTFGVNLRPLKLAEGLPPKGEAVVAFGAPLGFDFTASEGIVSGIRRSTELENVGIEGRLGTWVQTTAPISPGNSGGPLVNCRGEVVAVNTLTYTLGQNLNLAISASDVHTALASRSAEPKPLSEVSKDTLLAEFGIGDNPESKPEVAIDPKTKTEIERLLAEGEKPLKDYAGQTGPLFSAQAKEWQEQLAKAYDEVGDRDPRWDEHVKTLFAFQHRDESRDDLIRTARSIAAAGCKDPAAMMICALAFLPEERAMTLAKRAYADLDDSKYPLILKHKLGLLFLAIQAQFPGERDDLMDTLKSLREEFLEVLGDASLTAFDRRMLYDDSRKILGTLIHEHEVDFLEQLESTPGIDPWLKEMLSGRVHHKLGWRARGGGYANGVSEQQWQVFYAKMAEAQSHWLKAWQMHPDYPEAATELLRTTMAYQGVAGEDARFWLERAVEAQFDYEPAYESYLWAIRPRWGGSHEKMLAFGRECLATKRFDSKVPWQFHEAVQAVASELGEDGSNIYGRLGIADDYLEAIQGYRKNTEDQKEQNYLDSQTACVLLLAGRAKEARPLVKRLGEDIDEAAFESFDADMDDLLDELR